MITLRAFYIVNSSFLVLDSSRFRKTLSNLGNTNRKSAVRSLTCSSQINWHLQSYLLYFDINNLPIGWAQRFFENIEPVNGKMETILRYEIGLGQSLKKDKIITESLFQPSLKLLIRNTFRYMCTLLRIHGIAAWTKPSMWSAWREINWAHFGAHLIAERHGVVKCEFLRNNPYLLSEKEVWKSCSKDLLPSVKEIVNRTRPFYKRGKDNVTELAVDTGSLEIIKQTISFTKHQVIGASVAVVVHLHYIELLEEILSYVSHIIEPFDLYITTPFEADLPKIIEETDNRQISVNIIVTKNQGRDIAPFISLYRKRVLDKYDAVLKIHSKKSSYSKKGDFWRRELINSICGSSLVVLKSLLLLREHGFGLIGPSKYFLTDPKFWGSNKERLSMILKSCGLDIISSDPKLAFFAGSMFWFSPKVLGAIHNCDCEALAFEQENGQQDGTLAHAWERAFCLIARAANWSCTSPELEGRDLFDLDKTHNEIPVLKLG